jgi:hypothetical protein
VEKELMEIERRVTAGHRPNSGDLADRAILHFQSDEASPRPRGADGVSAEANSK